MVYTPSDIEELFITVAVLGQHSTQIWRSGTIDSRAESVILLFRQQQKLLKALEKLEAGPSYNIAQSVKTDYGKQRVSQWCCSEWITPNIAGCDGDISCKKLLWMFCVDIAEKAVLSRGHPCIVCYHGDPVKLGERLAGRADWVAVPLPQKQEAVCFASRHRHQERWLPRESGGTCQWKGEGESLQPASASCLNSTQIKWGTVHWKLARYTLHWWYNLSAFFHLHHIFFEWN